MVKVPSRPARRFVISARWRLTLSYAGFLLVAGLVLFVVALLFLFRYIPDARIQTRTGDFIPNRSDLLRAFLPVAIWALVILAAIGVVGGWFLAGWMLRPLRRINRATQLAASGNLEYRIRLGRRDEFGQLADNFDRMLARLDDAFSTQERFAANASHELRTPLAITATLLDVARNNPEGQDYSQLIDRLSQTNQRAIDLTDSLLRLASVDAVTAAFTAVNLAILVNEVVVENRAEAIRHNLSIETAFEDVVIMGDPVLLHQLAVNLVQNAIRHNHSGGTVGITLVRSPKRSHGVLRVENTGVEYTTARVAELTEPFLRGSGRTAVTGQPSGHGLGLSLVARIVAVHNGRLALKPRPHGGLVVTVTLPVRGSNQSGNVRASRISQVKN